MTEVVRSRQIVTERQSHGYIRQKETEKETESEIAGKIEAAI